MIADIVITTWAIEFMTTMFVSMSIGFLIGIGISHRK